MAVMNYVFGLLRTGEVLAELPLGSVSITNKLSDYGELRATLALDLTGFDNATTKGATVPGLCYVVAERGGQPVWGGIVWSRTYQSQAKTLELYAKTFEAYPTYRFMPTYSRTNVDQMSIFIELWNMMQSDAGSNLGIIIPTSFPEATPVLSSVDVAETDFRTYRSVMDDLANGDQGFDWTIDWAKSGSAYSVQLRAEQPFLGASNSLDALTFEYPGNILNYYETDSVSDGGTNVVTMGAGQSDGMLIATTSRPDLIDAGFLRIDFDVQSKETTNQAILNALAIQQGALHTMPVNVIKVQHKADHDPIFGSYGLGDRCNLVIQDAWHTGIDKLVKTTRIVQWSYSPPESDQVEEVELIFEGEQADDGA